MDQIGYSCLPMGMIVSSLENLWTEILQDPISDCELGLVGLFSKYPPLYKSRKSTKLFVEGG